MNPGDQTVDVNVDSRFYDVILVSLGLQAVFGVLPTGRPSLISSTVGCQHCKMNVHGDSDNDDGGEQ